MRIEFERRQRGVRFHGSMRDFIRDEPRFSHVIRFGKTLLGIAKRVVIILFQIARLVVVDEVRLRLHRFFRIEVGGQHFVLYIDEFQRFLSDGFRNGDHARNVVADVTHFVERKRVLIVADGKNSVRIGRVLADDHSHHAVKHLGTAGIDAFNARMRIRRMQNLPDQHSGNAEIVSVFARTGGLFRGVDHGRRLADDGEITHFHSDQSCHSERSEESAFCWQPPVT